MAVTQQHGKSGVVIEERHGSIATIRMDRAEKLNAINGEMARALVHALLRVAEDREVRVVVITGAGRAFSAGGDLEAIRDMRNRRALNEFQSILVAGKEICLAIATMPKLVVAAVNGPAAGAGMSIALACDLRIASQEASFSQSFARIGLYPDFGASFFLPRLVGLSRASELFYTAETLSASEACRIGIVCRVCEPAQFEEDVRQMSEELAAGPPLAYRDVKRTMIADQHTQLEQTLDEEIRLQTHCFLSEDCAEGLLAFSEKRKPKFRDH